MMHEAHMQMFGRAGISLILGGGKIANAARIAQDLEQDGTWGDTLGVDRVIGVARNSDKIMMTGTPATGSDISDADMNLWSDASTAFLEEVRAATLLGRIEEAIRLPFHRSAIESVTAVGAGWVEQGKAIPVRQSFYGAIAGLPARKVAAQVVVPSEVSTTPIASKTIGAELRRAVVEQMDLTFLGDGAGSASEPAGIRANAIQISSTGVTVAAIVNDIVSMVDAVIVNGGQPKGAVWIVPTSLWARYTTLKIADAGGTLAGLPVLVSDAATCLVLLAARQLVIVEGNLVDLAIATAGLIEQDDTPTGDTTTPTTASATPISLFQTDSVALRATLRANWIIGGATVSDGRPAVVELA